MSDDNDSWGLKPAVPWIIGVVGLCLMPGLWPLGVVLVAVAAVMIAKSVE